MRAMMTGAAIIGVAVLVVLTALYNGLCFEHGGFPDDLLSEDRAIGEVIKRYPPTVELERRDLGGGRSISRMAVPERPLAYESVSDFRHVNPDCCAVVDRGSEGYRPSFLSRLLGKETRIVRVRYLVRYRDAAGVAMSKPTETHVVLGRCGEVFKN